MKEVQVREARQQLLNELPDPTELVRGLPLHRRIFHRRGCLKCRWGEGHRIWVLTVGYPGGRTRQFTIPAEQEGQVQRWLRNYRELRGPTLSPIAVNSDSAAWLQKYLQST